MNNAQHHYALVRARVDELARQCERDPATILLIAVSKSHSLEEIMSAYEAGCRDFGESRVSEALDKMTEAPDDIHWHLIGNLQSNKVNKIIGRFVLIHSVDSMELAKKISRSSIENGVITQILVEVNTSGEPSKHGLVLGQCSDEIASILQLPGVSVRGLMTMAPMTMDKTLIRHCFASLRHLRDEILTWQGIPADFKELSMGMSGDYPEAIAEGSTILRLGTAIFDPKDVEH